MWPQTDRPADRQTDTHTTHAKCKNVYEQKTQLELLVTLTSQKNSFPRRPQNQEIHETSSELLISINQPATYALHKSQF